ncbi:MAG: hypothetical protein R6U29_08320 [Desulfosudaceae bacterium]
MTEDSFSYTVKCRTCHKSFTVQLFESHEKNLFLVDRKDWYCEACKKEYARRQTEKLTAAHESRGFPPLTGTRKMIVWAEKIRADMLNKADIWQERLTFADEASRTRHQQAFALLMREWQQRTEAKWWIDNRRMTVRDMARRVEQLAAEADTESEAESKQDQQSPPDQ